MSYRHYSREEIKQVHEIDMVEFLENYLDMRYGFHRGVGGEYRSKEHSGLAVHPDRRQWSWFSHAISGNDAIDFLQQYEKLSFYEAVELLFRKYSSFQNASTSKIAENRVSNCDTPSPFLFEPDKSSSYRRLYAYLIKTRCIDHEIVQALVDDRKIYQDRNGNIVFRGFDETGRVRYAAKRGTCTNQRFCQECRGSEKRYGFRFGNDSGDTVFVFEAAIDAMSHATLALRNGSRWREQSRLALGGVSDIALVEYLRTHPNTKRIIIGLDNDDTGNSIAVQMKQKYQRHGYTVERVCPVLKDFNEDLCTMIRKEDTNTSIS